MNKLILTIIFLLTIFVPVSSGQNARTFTNDDLEKYKDASHKRTARAAENAGPDVTEQELLFKVYENNLAQSAPKKYVIPYKGTARRIIIDVTFDRSITVPMLLDTGAPGMHISVRLAEKLGILENDEGNLLTLTGGIGGTAPAIFTIIDSIQVGEAEDTFIPTTISELNIPGFEGLVGMDFMGKYAMQLDNKKRVVILEELPESALRPAGHDELWWRSTFSNFKSMRDAWGKYRDDYSETGAYTASMKGLQDFLDKQYGRADYLYNRLKVYASEHSVPLEWR